MIFKKVYFYVLTVVLTSLFIVSCEKEELREPGSQHTGNQHDKSSYFVKRVVDGDTIELANGKLVRYIGVDTPEIRKRTSYGWEYAPAPYALQARDYNSALLRGEKVRLEFDVERRDKYGRWLAYVYVDGKMVNEELLRQGYARLFVLSPNIKYLKLLTEAQEEAKENKRGLWGE